MAKVDRELVYHQLALFDCARQRAELEGIDYRRGANSQVAAQLRVVTAHTELDYRTIIDKLIELAFLTVIEGVDHEGLDLR